MKRWLIHTVALLALATITLFPSPVSAADSGSASQTDLDRSYVEHDFKTNETRTRTIPWAGLGDYDRTDVAPPMEFFGQGDYPRNPVDSTDPYVVPRKWLFHDIYRPSVRLQMDPSAACSGTLIRSRFVLTAGHCLYTKASGWVNGATLWVASYNSYLPFSETQLYGASVSGAWYDNEDSKHDWGVVLLWDKIGEGAGWSPLHVLSKDEWENRSFNMPGFPNGAFIVYNAPGIVNSTHGGDFLTTSSYHSEGQSGSGVHAWGWDSYTSAVNHGTYDDCWPTPCPKSMDVIIDSARYDTIVAYMDAYENYLSGDLGYANWRYMSSSNDNTFWPPALVSYPNGSQRYYDMFFRRWNGEIIHSYRMGATYPPSESLGGVGWDFPSALSWSAEYLDVLTAGQDDYAWEKWSNGTSWNPSQSGWNALDTSEQFVGPLTMTSCGTDKHLFGVGSSGAIQYKHGFSSTWYSGWSQITGHAPEEGVAAMCIGTPGDYEVMIAVCSNQRLYSKRRYHDGSWSAWSSQLDYCAETPTLVKVNTSVVDLLYRTNAGGYVHHMRSVSGNSWGSIHDLGGAINSRIAAVSLGPNDVHLYVVGMGGAIFDNYSSDGVNFSGWNGHLGGYMFDVAATSSASNRVEFMARGRNATVYYRYWDGNQWSTFPRRSVLREDSILSPTLEKAQ